MTDRPHDSPPRDRSESGIGGATSIMPAGFAPFSAAEDSESVADAPRWAYELRRWLATLNPGRTQREYEKAVTYFFKTPGVPERLDEISLDLLLAYRGVLALRATAHNEPPTHVAYRHSSRAQLEAPTIGRLSIEGESGAAGGAHAQASAAPRDEQPTPLAPATVNLRLTALRQFLTHCALFGSLSHISVDRLRAALRPLSIERRRPYQILAEPEWGAFLQAALSPSGPNSADAQSGDSIAADSPQPGHLQRRSGPWGVPRAVRLERAKAARAEAAMSDAAAAAPESAPPRASIRSRSGLTGARTAMRDHALLSLALATGLRAIELVSLDVGDLSREWHAGKEEWWLVLPDKKTKGQRGGRTLPLAPDLIRLLLAYVQSTDRRWERAADRATPLFLAQRRKEPRDTPTAPPRRLSLPHVRRIVDRVETQWLALQAGRDGDASVAGTLAGAGDTRQISPHALRHSTAIALLEGNVASGRPPASVEHVRGWLGHFDIRTTQGYLAHLDGRRQRRPFALSPGDSAADNEK